MGEYYLLPTIMEEDEQNSFDSWSSPSQTKRKRRRSLFINGIAVGVISQLLAFGLAGYIFILTGKYSRGFFSILLILVTAFIAVHYFFVGRRDWEILCRLMRNKGVYDEGGNFSPSFSSHLCSWCVEFYSFHSGALVSNQSHQSIEQIRN